jgi:HPt (histidine-containing phosphotransfer) domain-containing protein
MYDPSKIEQLRELMDNDRAEMLSLAEEYGSNSIALIGQLREAVADQSPTALTRAAHTLKSSSALMGASGLARLCEELEALGRQGQVPPDAGQRVGQIEASFAEAISWIRHQIEG